MSDQSARRRLVPIEDAQRELGGIGRTTLYRLIEDGYLTRANIGRRAFITGNSLDSYIDSITDGR